MWKMLCMSGKNMFETTMGFDRGLTNRWNCEKVCVESAEPERLYDQGQVFRWRALWDEAD